jgi:hypothetical protein
LYLIDLLLLLCTAVVTDSGANIVKAVDIAFGKNLHIPCCAHTLNLVAERSIENVPNLSTIINKVKSIVIWFKQSVVASDELRKQTSTKLIQEVPTRWNSKYYTLERFIKLRAQIKDIVNRHFTAPSMLNALEIQQMEEVVSLLRPLEAATKELCGENYVTASKIIPMTFCLANKIDSTKCHETMAIQLKEVLHAEIKRRFGHIEEVRLMALATLLDPRFKRISFQNALACSKAVTSLRNVFQETTEEKESGSDNEEREMEEDEFMRVIFNYSFSNIFLMFRRGKFQSMESPSPNGRKN